MKYIAALLVSGIIVSSPARAEAPCDFKGVSVGSKMTPAAIMAAFGVTKYKLNPTRPAFDFALAQKSGPTVAEELVEWNMGAYCDETACRIPFGITVGTVIPVPISVFIAVDQGLIIEIDVTFSETYWEEVLPILDQKYGADWKVERSNMLITDYETNRGHVLPVINMRHITNGWNRATNDRCQISADNLDLIFEHKDARGPYHSVVSIKLVSKNF
jgi:hypothetical protein